MIDFRNEKILTFAEAARQLPRKRANRPIHIGTLYRWCSRGLKGVRLEVLKLGGSTVTSQEALQRFFERLSNAHPPSTPIVAASRKKEIEFAQRVLKEKGIS